MICGATMADNTFTFHLLVIHKDLLTKKKTGLKSDWYPNGLLGVSRKDYVAVVFSLPSQ